MEAMLMKEQVRPGDETQFMHAVFTSEEEMLTFYLTLNRFANPVSYFMQREDVERLENLQQTFGKFQHFTNLFSSYEARGIKLSDEVLAGYVQRQWPGEDIIAYTGFTYTECEVPAGKDKKNGEGKEEL